LEDHSCSVQKGNDGEKKREVFSRFKFWSCRLKTANMLNLASNLGPSPVDPEGKGKKKYEPKSSFFLLEGLPMNDRKK
jgi:hypothetical protein